MKISKILLLTFFLLAELQLNNTACAADRVLKKTITDTIKNDSAPLGHWEINIEYPILNGTTPAITKINTAIANAASEFQCEENNGDKQFTAEITVLNSNILSLKYTDSWYCAGMPQTEGRAGAMTFNLATGAMIVFDNEVRSSETKKLNENINAGLEKALIKKEVSDECPTPAIGYFYATEKDIVFVNSSENEETIQCEVEYKIPQADMEQYLKEDSVL